MYQTSDYTSQSYEYIDPSTTSLGETQQHPQQQLLLLDSNDLETVDLDTVRKINARMAPSNPKAPVCSNKNPLRLIQQGDRFITTQNIKNSSLQQIIQILANDALIKQSKDGPNVFCFHDRNVNSRILLRLEHARLKSQHQQNRQRTQSEKACSETGSHSSLTHSQDETPKRRRGRRPGRKNKTAEEEDPDFEPDLPIEEILPFPIIRKKAPVVASNSTKGLGVGRVSKPPKYLIKDYKHLRLEDLKEDDMETGEGENSATALSDVDSNVGYSDYDDGVGSNSGGESGGNRKAESLGFDCDKCEKSFSTRAGLSRHKMLKHNPNGDIKRVGPWSDPVLSALRRRNRLKEALEKATPEDIADIAAPKVAQKVSLWDYLFFRTEASVTSPTQRPRNPVPPPDLPSLLVEYIEFVNQFRDFLSKHVKVVESVNTSSDTKKLVDELETDEEDAVISCGGPAPASVKRRRYLRMKRRRKITQPENSDPANQDLESKTDVNNSPSELSVIERSSPQVSSKGIEATGTADEQDGVIRVMSQFEANVLGLGIGRYMPIWPPSEGYLPRRYGVVQQERPPPSSSASSTPKKSRTSDSLPKRALITTGEQLQPAQTIFENTRTNEEEEDLEPVLAPDPVDEEKLPSCSNPPAEQNFYLQNEGVGHPIPEEWITSGAFIPVILESGAWSDLVVEASTRRIFHRPTGQLVSMVAETEQSGGMVVGGTSVDETAHASSEAAATELAPQQVYVSDISPTTCLIITPSGARYQVEHGGEGVTSATIQAILQMKDC